MCKSVLKKKASIEKKRSGKLGNIFLYGNKLARTVAAPFSQDHEKPVYDDFDIISLTLRLYVNCHLYHSTCFFYFSKT